jgi:hypothetical protein
MFVLICGLQEQVFHATLSVIEYFILSHFFLVVGKCLIKPVGFVLHVEYKTTYTIIENVPYTF